jgi:hypothetical protein
MIAGNYTNNFQYVPEWLWDKHISSTEFLLYMALRSFSYPTGPTIEMLAAKTGFDPAAVLETVLRLEKADLAEPCPTDEYGEPCDNRWRFCYLKYSKDAADRAPAPPPRNLMPEEIRHQFEVTMAKDQEAYYAAHPGAKEAGQRGRQENAEWAAAERKQWEQQEQNLRDPNYLRSGGPINPDIRGMVDRIKHLYWTAMADISSIQYRLGDLAGLALLDPDANHTLQNDLSELADAIWSATVSNVVDRAEVKAEDYLYEQEFENTYFDGREIAIRIHVENELDAAKAAHTGAILESFAVLEFPRGVIYHINPVDPPRLRPSPEPSDNEEDR